MKKLLLLSLVTIGSTLISCSKEDKPTNLSMSGKWNFSTITTISGENKSTVDLKAGFSNGNVQCDDTPDYMKFTDASNIEYGDNNTQDSPDCTLNKIGIKYKTTPTEILFVNNTGGTEAAFKVIKQTAAELQLQVDDQGKTYIYNMVKAVN